MLMTFRLMIACIRIPTATMNYTTDSILSRHAITLFLFLFLLNATDFCIATYELASRLDSTLSI